MTKDKKTKDKNAKPNKWKVYISIFVIFTAISMTFHAISGPIIYPTDSHREVAENYEELLDAENFEFDLDDPTGSEEINKIETSPEMRYSNRATTITTVLSIVVWIVLLGFSYSYLRKNRIGKNQVKSLALIDATSTALMIYPVESTAKYLGYPENTYSIPGFDGPVYTVFMIIATFGFIYILSYIILSLFKLRYDKKFSFSIED